MRTSGQVYPQQTGKLCDYGSKVALVADACCIVEAAKGQAAATTELNCHFYSDCHRKYD